MSLSTFVIINQISNLSDARYCAGMGADVLGFVIEPGQPGSIDKMTFSDITGWVAGALLMAEFTAANRSEISHAVEEFGLDLVLLNRLLPPAEIQQIGVPVMLRLPFSEAKDLEQKLEEYGKTAAYYLIDLQGKTQLSEEEVSFLMALSNRFPLVLTHGITAANVQDLLAKIEPLGICLQGGHEIKPGLRDFDELADILEQLEQD